MNSSTVKRNVKPEVKSQVNSTDSSDNHRASSADPKPLSLCTVDGVPTAFLPTTDRGTAYGHGLFETMLYSSSKVPLWQYHRERIAADALALGISLCKQSLEDNLSVFLNLLEGQSQNSGIIKIIVTAGSGGRGYALPESLKPRIICQYSSLPDNLNQARQEGVVLTQCDYRLPSNPALAGIKHLNRLDQIMARSEWKAKYADGLMYDYADLLIETTCANIFIKTASGWLTPKLEHAGVNGVMRGLLLEQLFSQCGLRVTVSNINKQQVADAVEIFTCSSIRGVVPVTQIRHLGQWIIGSDTKRLQSLLFDHYDCYPC